MYESLTQSWGELKEEEKYKRFMLEECNFKNSDRNNYIISKFEIDARC